MSAPDRLFFAVWPPDDVRTQIAAILAPLRRDYPSPVRWQPDHRLHITTLYLGEFPDVEVAMATGNETARALHAGPLRVESAGRYGTVMWLGVVGDWLAGVHRQLRRTLRIPRESRPYRPHITVARVRSGRPPAQPAAALRAVRTRVWTPTELTLVRSRIGPDPQYTVIGRHPFRRDVTP